jgi:hypothetical protein
MKAWIGMVLAALLEMNVSAESRFWTSTSGEVVEGEYIAVVFDHVVIKSSTGIQVKLPLKSVSDEDRRYVELVNPPELAVDFLESADQEFIKPSPIWVDNSPLTQLHHTFGARVTNAGMKGYDHELTVEVFALAQQVYDPDKYQLVFRGRSDPFRLTAANRFRYEYRGSKSVPLSRFLLAGEYPRGKKMAESLVLVRDERGEIIAYNTTKKWLYAHHGNLLEIPVGGWLDQTCTRRHPTSPKPVWLD